MKNIQGGFIVPLLVIVIILAVIGGGAYVYLNKNRPQNSDTIQVTDIKNVTDFDTCMNFAKNISINFDIVFAHGSDFQYVEKFANDFQTAYPRAQLKTSSEQDYLNDALAYNGGSIKTTSDLQDYKKRIIAQADSKISVSVPLRDLGSHENFAAFVSTTLNKYPSIKFQQYAGSSPDNELSGSRPIQIQQSMEKQCDYKYKTLNASDRAELDLKNADFSIQMGLRDAAMITQDYYGDHNAYAPDPLSRGNGVCSDTTVKGLQKSVDSIKEIAGATYCYASSKTFAMSAPLKSNPTIGYCVDSTGFFGTTTAPDAASKGYCIQPKKVIQDISACNNGGTARTRWICVGNIVDPYPYQIGDIVMPYATPVSQKIEFCKTYSGIEADYCFSSIVKAGYGLNVDESTDAAAVCKMVSNQNPWFKNDCMNRD